MKAGVIKTNALIWTISGVSYFASSSLLATWRKERDEAIRKGLQEQKRGPKPQTDPRALERQKLVRENGELTEQLRKARMVIDVQKKVVAVLGRALPEMETLV